MDENDISEKTSVPKSKLELETGTEVVKNFNTYLKYFSEKKMISIQEMTGKDLFTQEEIDGMSKPVEIFTDLMNLVAGVVEYELSKYKLTEKTKRSQEYFVTKLTNSKNQLVMILKNVCDICSYKKQIVNDLPDKNCTPSFAYFTDSLGKTRKESRSEFIKMYELLIEIEFYTLCLCRTFCVSDNISTIFSESLPMNPVAFYLFDEDDLCENQLKWVCAFPQDPTSCVFIKNRYLGIY